MTVLDEVGRLQHTLPAAEVASWKQELKTTYPAAERGAWLHLWLGEWELAQNQQPEQAAWHFRQAQHLTNPQNRCYGLAAYDQAMALFYAGAYADATDAFAALLHPKTSFPGYDRRNCALWLRHAEACTNYHAQNAALGVPEPPRLDPYCGAAALAACLRSLSRPYDRQTIKAVCPVTGEGSSLQNVLDAGRKLGLSTRAVTADDQGLIALPKPLVAYVEQDHFVALVRADKAGVSYLCSDCGPWPGGQVDLTWKQWHALSPGIYAAVTKPGSTSDALLREALASQKPFSSQNPVSPPAVRVSYTGSLKALHLDLHLAAALSALRGHVNGYTAPKATGCGNKPESLHCPDIENCCLICMKRAGKPHAATSGDPVNAATGEEEYTPDPDLVVYNPRGPSISWSRIYNSLRAATVYPDPGPGVNYGVGWSYSYNYRLYAPNGVGPSSFQPVYLLYPNGSYIPIGSYSTSASNPGQNGPVKGTPYSAAGGGAIQITLKDHSKWTFAPFSTPTTSYANLTAITDRWGHSIHFQYSTSTGSSFLTSITDDNSPAKVLLTVNGYQSIADCYGRTVWYQTTNVPSTNVPSSYPQSLLELTGVSQTVASTSNTSTPPSSLPMRYTYGYDDVQIGDPGTGNGEGLAFLHTITVPSPTQSGTSTATIWYQNEPNITNPNTGITTKNPNYSNPSTNSSSGPYVSAIVDSNSNVTSITPVSSANQTTVKYTDSKGNVLGTSLYSFDSIMRLVSTTDYNQQTTQTLSYASTAYNYEPSSVTDGDGNTWSYTWDTSGNLLTETPPSSAAKPATSSANSTRTPATTTYVYNYYYFPLGELATVQTGSKQITSIYYTSLSNVKNTYNSDYISMITSPQPGTQGTSAATVASSFAFDTFGNLTSMTMPGNNATNSTPSNPQTDKEITTTFNYTTDGSYTQTEAYGQRLTATDNLGHITHYRYDAQGQLTSVTDALGNQTSVTYNEGTGAVSLGNQLQEVYYPATNQSGSNNSFTTYNYQYVGGPLTSVVADNENSTAIRQVNYQYGNEEELLSVTGSTEPVQYGYDGLYRISTLTDGDGHTTGYFYNASGYLDSITFPGYAGAAYPNVSGADSIHYAGYDGDGNPGQRIDGNGVTTTYTYNDPEALLTGMAYSGGTLASVSYAYDVYDRLSSMTDGTGTVSYPNYDDLDNPLSVQTTYTGLPTQTIGYSYFNDGSRSGMSVPGRTYSYLYDGAGRPTSLNNNYDASATWTYQNNNWLNYQTDSNGLVLFSSFNPLGQLIGLQNFTNNSVLSNFGSTVQSSGIVHDGVGNIVSVPSSISGAAATASYAYDNRDQLTQEVSTRGSGFTNQFGYDVAGNPTAMRSIPNLRYNFDNQAITPNGITPAFTSDGNGNPGAAHGAALSFDPENRLTAAGAQTTQVPTAIATGADGVTRLLWNNSDGSITLSAMNSSTGATTTPNYSFGPYPGWTATALAVNDGSASATTHVMWTNSDGQLSVWNYTPANGSFTQFTYSPPTAGMTATAITDGPDGLTRVLWNSPTSGVTIWSLSNTNGAVSSSYSFGPYAGWTASAVSVGTDNTTHVLWTNTSGAASVWNYNTANGSFAQNTYGPYPGWSAKAIADGTDGKQRLLWGNIDGHMAFWNLNNTAASFAQTTYGPYAGWVAVSLTNGSDNEGHVLWSNVNGSGSIWNLNPSTAQDSIQPTIVPGTVAGTGATFAYRGDGLRAWKQNSAGTRVYYLYDGSLPVCEINSQGQPQGESMFGPNGLVSYNDGSHGTLFYAFDERGNTAQRVNTSGSLVSTDSYDAYGQRLSGGSYVDAYGYGGQAGYRTDAETGLSLLTNRYYDPAQGRFVTRDPMGYGGGINLYSYTQNNPGNEMDPDGMQAEPAEPIEPGRKDDDDEGDAATETAEGLKIILDEIGEGIKYAADATNDAIDNYLAGEQKAPANVSAGRWMSQDEYNKMEQTGRIQPSWGAGTWGPNDDPMDVSQGTIPPNPETYKNYKPGSVFAQFDIPKDLSTKGMNSGSAIFFGSNSRQGQLYIKRGGTLEGMPRISNLRVTAKCPSKK